MARAKQFPPSVDPGIPIEPADHRGWTRRTFGELLEPVERPAVLTAAREYQLVTVKRNREGVVARERLRGDEVLTKTQFFVATDDFLMSKRQIIHGACGLVPPALDGAIVSNEYAVLRPRANLDLEYLRQLTHTPYFQRTCFHSSHGVDVEKMIFKIDKWFEYSLPIPPLDEQRRIAATLGSVDAYVAACGETLRHVEALRAAQIADLLGDEEVRWQRAPLGDVCVDGGRYGANVPKRPHDPAHPRYVRITDIAPSGRLRSDEPASIRSDEAGPYLLARGDVVVARSGATVGKSYVYDDADGPCAHAGYLIRYRPLPDVLDAGFLGIVLQSKRYWDWVKSAQRAQAQPNINAAEYARFPVPIPPLDEQRRVVAIVSATSRARDTQERAQRCAAQSAKRALAQLLLGAIS